VNNSSAVITLAYSPLEQGLLGDGKSSAGLDFLGKKIFVAAMLIITLQKFDVGWIIFSN